MSPDADGRDGGPRRQGRPSEPDDREARLDALKEEARRRAPVEGSGGPVIGGPIPGGGPARRPGGASVRGRAGEGHAGGDRPWAAASGDGRPGYYGLPVVKPPVWTWEIPAYFFVGGLSGMSAVIGAAALALDEDEELARAALWIAAGGAPVSAALLVLDLGRPARFLNMLRVFKWRSPMSVGAWLLSVYGAFAVAAAVQAEPRLRALPRGTPEPLRRGALYAAAGGAAATGSVLATYTGVLIGATAIPAWHAHRSLLPAHFGAAAFGSAAAALELLGFRRRALHAIGVLAAGAESVVAAGTEARRHGPADRALREGRSGALVRAGSLLAGPVALGLRLVGRRRLAGAAFLAGALIGRFGWIEAGRASGRDPEATLCGQRETRHEGRRGAGTNF